jgi:hypothetical protein
VRQLPSVPKNAISLNHRYLNVFTNSCGEPFLVTISLNATFIFTAERDRYDAAGWQSLMPTLDATGSVPLNILFANTIASFPMFFVSSWLALYGISGFLLRCAHRFDIGFQWFNRTFDIDKKPLQSIGLVAGVLVAVVYWAAVIVSRIV